MDKLYEEIIKIINEKDEYSEIFEILKLKYQKTGKLTGIIHLESPSKNISNFLFPISKKNESSRKISVKAEDILREFKANKFKELDNLILMKKLYGKSFFFKKNIESEERDKKIEFFSKLPLQDWLNKKSNRKVEKLYKESPKKLKEILNNIEKFSKMIDKNRNLKEKEYIPLPYISGVISRDSHYFDRDKIAGKLFVDYLCFLSNREGIKSIEELDELFMEFYIVKDEFFNFTMAYNLLGEESWKGFWKMKQPLNLSLYNIRKSHKIFGIDKKIFVVENPSIFRMLMELIIKQELRCTILCTSGQLNLSSLLILDRAVESGNKIFYSGDFDPEGLQIAQKLKIRYKKNLNFFNMTVEDYKYCSCEKDIEKRLTKLENIVIIEFKELVSLMKIEKKSGYQELLIEKYKKFLLSESERGKIL